MLKYPFSVSKSWSFSITNFDNLYNLPKEKLLPKKKRKNHSIAEKEKPNRFQRNYHICAGHKNLCAIM
ncbi:hypothetical protein BpHYR1_023952 [Brachionus plicatilis]|uniref:Uncharacterized protein n=1 Tax=Brachionus plicatilis TaxID=10195 RepID=A0A3M7SPV2_BRAPC|nr:hypothetical protein BpHYR1_023952 [Brachionus plicatilis]